VGALVRGVSCIPPRRNRRNPAAFGKCSYRYRHRIEHFFERINDFRRVTTRYDKLASSLLGFVCFPATRASLLW
jgi:transposase